MSRDLHPDIREAIDLIRRMDVSDVAALLPTLRSAAGADEDRREPTERPHPESRLRLCLEQ